MTDFGPPQMPELPLDAEDQRRVLSDFMKTFQAWALGLAESVQGGTFDNAAAIVSLENEEYRLAQMMFEELLKEL